MSRPALPAKRIASARRARFFASRPACAAAKPRAGSLARLAAVIGAAVLLGALAGCTPALDWRDARPSGSALQLLFPCKPSAQQRELQLAGQSVKLSLHACTAAGQTWGLAYADMGEVSKVAGALDELLHSAAANLGAATAPGTRQLIPGASPEALSQRAQIDGRLPDGTSVRMQCIVFARGTLVYQLSALGQTLDQDAVQTFIESIRFAP